MTRKYALLFVVIIIFVLSILEGLLGTQGYFVNQELSRAISKEQFLRDAMALEAESLQKRLDTVWEEDELRDNALKLGYSVAGDTVFHFSDLHETEVANLLSDRNASLDSTDLHFKGMPFWLLFSISVIVSGVLTIGMIRVMTRCRERKERDSGQSGTSNGPTGFHGG